MAKSIILYNLILLVGGQTLCVPPGYFATHNHTKPQLPTGQFH